jgi:hypothetical protein
MFLVIQVAEPNSEFGSQSIALPNHHFPLYSGGVSFAFKLVDSLSIHLELVSPPSFRNRTAAGRSTGSVFRRYLRWRFGDHQPPEQKL